MEKGEIDDLIRTFVADWGFPGSVENADFEGDLRALIDKITTPPKWASLPVLNFEYRRKITFGDEDE